MSISDKLNNLENDPVAVAYAWQSHRMKCLELAVSTQSGETMPTWCAQKVINIAQEFSAYILTKSEIEKSVK